MVIDNNDVAFHCTAVHFSNEAAIELAAFLPQTLVRAGIQAWPQRARFRQRRHLGSISRLGASFPLCNGAVLLDFFQATEHRLSGEVVELLPAQIIVASLHVADAQMSFTFGKERALEKRNVLAEELLLQIFGSGGDDYALP